MFEKNLGRQLFFEALKTAPTIKAGAKLNFYLEEVGPFNKDEGEDARDHYLKECTSKGIIPFSQVWFNYPYHSFAIVNRSGIFKDDYIRDPQIIDALLTGGRIHEIGVNIETWQYNHHDICETFVRDYLPLLAVKGYRLDTSNIHLNHDGDSSQVHNQRYQSYLYFNVEGNQSNIKLDIGSETRTEWRITELKEWFSKLISKTSMPLRLFA